MTRPIQLLSAAVTRRIAAGEVVSRPLDVVRELVENALDAGASRIELEIEGGGLGRVTVRDNGEGIPADSVALAAARHATSKLSPEPHGSLQVTTLGFRGEALWATAQAGELELLTRPTAQVGAMRLRAQGDHNEVSRTSAPAGTAVTVTRLFAHLPARLRTQAPAAAEVRDITALLGRYVLHHPAQSWRLTVDGEPRLTHAPSGHRDAVATVYGALSANRLLSVEGEGVRGVVSRPELTRARRDRMHFSVNRRPVLAPPELEKAVLDAYAELLPSGTAPLCVLDLTVSPEDCDPNIHPAKQVVALADLAGVAARVKTAVAQALAGQVLTRPLPELRLPPTPEQLTPNQFPHLTLLGVYQDLYLLAQGEGDLWVIDAHAAHERVLYETLLAQADAALELPAPEMFHLTPDQTARLHERGDELRGWGLDLEDFGAGLARLRSIPAALAGLNVPKLHDLLVETALDPQQTGDPRRTALARLACLPALKAGRVDMDSGTRLLEQLRGCGQPWACPHGRPTVLRFSERDLAHSFGRRGVRDVARGRDELD